MPAKKAVKAGEVRESPDFEVVFLIIGPSRTYLGEAGWLTLSLTSNDRFYPAGVVMEMATCWLEDFTRPCWT